MLSAHAPGLAAVIFSTPEVTLPAIAGHGAHDVGAGPAVGEELFHSIGKESGGAEARLAEIASIHPLVIGEAGHELGLTDHGAAFRKADKACGAGADALHGGCAGVILLHIYARGQILCHVLASRLSGNMPAVKPPPFMI